MDQLVKALYRNNQVVNGHNTSSDRPMTSSRLYCFNFETYQDVPPNSPVNGVDSKEVSASQVYKKIQRGADIPIRGLQKLVPEKPAEFRHQTSDVLRRSLPSDPTEEPEATRKQRLETFVEENRRKRSQVETDKNASRKHHDFFTPAQKSPISPNRYEDVVLSPHTPLSPGSRTPKPRSPPDLTDGLRGLHLQGTAQALFTFTAQDPRELSFKTGDVLYLLCHVDRNWMLGEHYGRVGIFPANYVKMLTSIDVEGPSQDSTMPGLARAKFDFHGSTSTELSLKKGEFVTILRRVDRNWLEGCLGQRRGLLPVSYVHIIREPAMLSPMSSVVTTSLPGTPDVLSPMSWKPATPPHKPSSAIHASFSPDTSQDMYGPLEAFSCKSLSSDEFTEFSDFYQKDILNSQTNDEDFDVSMDRFSFPESLVTSTPSKIGIHNQARSEVPSQSDLSNTNSNNRSWSQVSHESFKVQKYTAICAYKPEHEDELELVENEEVLVTRKCDDGWFMGMSTSTGRFGAFPGSCVQESG